MQTSSFIKKVFFTLALFGYLGMTLLAPLHMVHMAKMGIPMEDCPFAFGEHSLCEMNAIEHIKAWQSFSTTALATMKILSFVIMIFILFSWAYHAPPVIKLPLHQIRKCSKIIPIYQLLFSKGILNPKIP